MCFIEFLTFVPYNSHLFISSLSNNSQCLGRKVSYEKSATAFSLKLGKKRNEVIQEFDAFVSNVGVDPTRYSVSNHFKIIDHVKKTDHTPDNFSYTIDNTQDTQEECSVRFTLSIHAHCAQIIYGSNANSCRVIDESHL